MNWVLVKAIYDKTRRHRVAIYERSDKHYIFREEHFEPHEDESDKELLWIPSDEVVSGIYDTEEGALNGALENIPWLKERKKKNKA